MKLSRPLTSEDAPNVHRTKHLGEPHNGKVHTLLVPALEELFSRLDEPRSKKSPGSETLKTSSFSCPQTTPIPTTSAASDEVSSESTPYGSKILSLPRKETIACRSTELRYQVESHSNNNACLVVIVGTLPPSFPFPPIAILRATPCLERLEVDRDFLGQAILGISMGVIQRTFAPVP